MAVGCATGNRDDNPRLPPLSLGLSSVRFIVNKLEAEYARVTADNSETGREIVKYDPNVDEGYDDYDDSPLDHSRGQVWHRFAANLGVAFSRLIPSVTLGNFGLFALTTGFFTPRMITYLVVYPFCRLVFGTLYPAYASYKAVRTKNLKEYVKWMMYWIVFALFTCTETFTDVFLSWFPFYYEVKIVLVLWLLSPATKGSSILYRKFVHPALCRREQEIDEYIAKAKDQGYHTVLNLGTKGVNYATTVIMQTAIKGGGGLVQQLRKSYSLSDLTECDPREERGSDEADDVLTEPRLIRRGGKSGYSTRRSASESNSRSPIYFPEVDVDVRPRARTDEPDFSHIKSSEDISSGYSSADNSASLTRTSSLGASARARGRTSRTTVTTIKRPQAAEGNEVIIEELQDDDTFEYANMPPLVNLPSQIFLSQTQPPFLYRYVGDKVEILQVLGDLPLDPNSNKNDNTDLRDQKEVITEETSIKKITKSKENTNNNNANIEMNTKEILSEEYDVAPDIPLISQNSDNNDDESSPNDKFDRVGTVQTDVDMEHVPISVEKDDITLEIMSHDTSNDFDSAESDDEASFGTPEDSPKSKRKSPKGKYGKGKAPAPPKVVCSEEIKDPVNSKNLTNEENLDLSKDEPKDFSLEKSKELSTENKEDMTENCKDLNKSTTNLQSTTSLESLVDIVENLSHTPFPETLLSKTHQLVVNPISEKKRRHKSKSPIRMPKSNSSGLGKLLQLPSKLAFWHKNEDKQAEEISTASEDRSRRSSTLEGTVDDFQSCHELDVNTSNDTCLSEIQEGSNSIHHKEQADDQISFKDATDLDSEIISQDIIDKSDALQKLIEAKIESHPEYKYISLHDETPTTSKTTDV